MLNKDYMDRNAKAIKTLVPEMRPLVWELLYRCANAGVALLITFGYRSRLEQEEIYAIGRTKQTHRKPVTFVRPGYSWHNHARAIDVVVVKPGMKELDWNDLTDIDRDGVPDYEEAGIIGESLGIIWGGRWKSPYDPGHFEWHPGLVIKGGELFEEV